MPSNVLQTLSSVLNHSVKQVITHNTYYLRIIIMLEGRPELPANDVEAFGRVPSVLNRLIVAPRLIIHGR